MTATDADSPPERFTPTRRAFETRDPEAGRAFMNAVYGTSLRMSGNNEDQLIRHSRYDLGPFCLDDMTLPMDAEYVAEPLEHLAVIQIHSGWSEHRPTDAADQVLPGDHERIGPDDINIIAQPDRPFSARASNLGFSGVLLDMPLVMRTAGIGEDAPTGPIRFSRLEPPSQADADRWRNSYDYVREVLETEFDAMSEPLVRGDSARLLAACALETFPNSAVPEPTSKDTRDATPLTVRKALAFIGENAGADIGPAEIAAAVRVSPRALQLAFARHHDTSVLGQVHRVRLDRAHFELLAADPAGGATVPRIAARWGFAKPGGFRTLYRNIYGVSPSETLAR
ncbi:helix-turn-helix transcriptional regulator [Streptomyces winkii]|uniref:helix-turn-helix transcriptional regulator n=1 Tax=Streptomyces winkii TaxID=3051178 RepID=UPI0028D4F573|nr:helix-turn-helix transcriptional regulator [Streptomyces sp. DSM 40971]